jgi:GTPase SAR1 family protein
MQLNPLKKKNETIKQEEEIETFRAEIWQQLQNLRPAQIARFAWICAVRAVPIIGCRGNFNFWKEEITKRHLQSFFNALDVNYGIQRKLLSADAAVHAAIDAADAADAAHTATYAAYLNGAVDTAARATNAAAHAVDTAARAADTAAYVARATDATTRSADTAANAARSADTAARTTRATTLAFKRSLKNIDIFTILKADLQSIKEQKVFDNYGITIYGEIWGNFQQALKNEDCEYWGKLYADIFNNRFVPDQEKLKQRLNVPKEIKKLGAEAVAKYLENLEQQGASNLNEARIIILGEKGAGKTCLARKLVNPGAKMTTEKESTPGVNTLSWNVGSAVANENINASIWDFAGHVVTHAVHQFFLSERCLYIIVYDGRSEARNRLEYWLDHMKNYGGESHALILVNKRDGHSVDIPINSLKERYNIFGIAEFSIKDDKDSLKEFRNRVALYIKNNPSWNNQKIPKNYYKVKSELESLFSKNEEKTKELISMEKFIEISNKHSITDTAQLLADLHALGISLWYKEMQKYATLVLNPEWISDGVYKIINWVANAKKHTIHLDEFPLVFEDCIERYPVDKHEFLFDLMKHYELAYETKCEKRLVIPHLLHEDRPAEQLPDFPLGEGLMLRYRAEQPLPPNTISRFIVRHNEQIQYANGDFRVWRYGVVLQDGKGSIALVREEKQMISVSVKGTAKTEFISALRETLNDIFNSYKSKKPDLEYRVERFGERSHEIENQYPLWLPGRQILNLATANKSYPDDISMQDIQMQPVAEKFKIEIGNLIVGGTGHTIYNDHSTKTFNFYNCNVGLQSNLNDLAQLLKEKGNTEDAAELENTAKALEQIEQCENKDEIKKKGIANRLKRIIDEFSNGESTLNKAVKGIKNGVSIAQDIGKGYNDVAQWLGLPQIPRPFLGK